MIENNNELSSPVNLKKKNPFQKEELKDGHREINKNNPKLEKGYTMVVKNKLENFSLDDLGTIENAKKHRSANRPLHKIGEFTEHVNFCRCCDLPCEEKGIIEPFNFCGNIDEFQNVV